MQANVRGVLLDIEGTTSSVKFVYEVMFPYARRELDAYLSRAWNTEASAAACEQIARDAGGPSLAVWTGDKDPLQAITAEVIRLMDADVKATGLKQLQGLIWRAGFESGQMVAHVYPDVPPALAAWRAAGLDLRIYSSGSVDAQRLFFGHTECGDLLPLFSGHYDTQIGGKREPASYTAIAQDWRLPPGDVLFLSDIAAELDAAQAAGMQTGLVLRPDNEPQPKGHPRIASFGELGESDIERAAIR